MTLHSANSIAFIGAGNMARSLISGLRQNQPELRLIAADPDAAQRAEAEALGAVTESDNVRAASEADVVVLAVKPQLMSQVMDVTRDGLRPGQLVISVAAGISIEALKRFSQTDVAVVRCMPNTPALLGLGMTGLFAEPSVSAEHRQNAEAILSAVGDSVWVSSEAELDAVIAVSGSGPAYFFYLMEQMIAAGEALGLDRDTATRLTVQTARGAAEMAKQSTDPIGQLRANVTSPGGTTAAALEAMASNGLPAAVEAGMRAAVTRAGELNDEFSNEHSGDAQ